MKLSLVYNQNCELNIIIEEKDTKISVIHDYFGSNYMKQNKLKMNNDYQEQNPDGKQFINNI